MFMLKTILSLSVILAVDSQKTYEDYIVIDAIPYTDKQLQLLNSLMSIGFDFWSNDINIESKARILASNADVDSLTQVLENSGMKVVISIPNVQNVINRQFQPAISRMRYTHGSFSWNTYHSLTTTYAYLNELPKMYPKKVKLEIIGFSVERRPIYAVIIDLKKTTLGFPPTAVIEGGAHAREWLSPATVTWIMKELLTSTNVEIKRMAENFIWHIIPILNPDGYHYTFTTDRLWKKNRNTAYFKPCSGYDNTLSNGVDLNRNFLYEWNKTGDLGNPCSLSFAGSSPMSEPESDALYNYVTGLKNTLIYYFSFHSYGQYIYIPYSYSVDGNLEKPTDYPDLFTIASKASQIIERKFGSLFKVGQAPTISQPLTGTSFDTFKSIHNTSISFMFGLRDNGIDGFLVSSSDIIPNNYEIMDAIMEIDRQARILGYYVPLSGSFRIFCLLNVLIVCSIISLLI